MKRTIGTLVLAAALGLLTAGCGGDSTDTDPGVETTEGDNQAPVDPDGNPEQSG